MSSGRAPFGAARGAPSRAFVTMGSQAAPYPRAPARAFPQRAWGRAAREAISNAVRHSGASHVAVSLTLAGENALLEISDDGAGFDPSQMVGRGHGLNNLRDRAQALGGELEIESEPGRGTWVRIRIPM